MVVEWDRPINLRTTFDKPPFWFNLMQYQMRILGAVSRIVSI